MEGEITIEVVLDDLRLYIFVLIYILIFNKLLADYNHYMSKNIFKALLINVSILIIFLILTVNDPKGIGGGILIFTGSVLFSLLGLITIILVVINKLKMNSALFLTSLTANLSYIVIFLLEINPSDKIIWILILIFPVFIGITQLVLFINKKSLYINK